jgi:hypothetical protein
VLSATGGAGIAVGLQDTSINSGHLIDFSQSILVIGVMFIGLAIVSKYRVTVDEAYKLGYDVGHEVGFKQGRKVGKPVVVDLMYPADEVIIHQQPLNHGNGSGD